jgi:DinB family protein
MMTRIKFLPFLALAVPALAQTPIKDALVKHWKASTDFTIAVAKLMPADDYGFKPVPEELSFGQVLVQVGGANLNACSNASGSKRPEIPGKVTDAARGKAEIDKDTAVQFLTDSFDFCNQAVASMTPEKLDAIVGPENRKMTGFEWLWAYFTHTAHHRGQLEVYLRLKGIKPPAYVF